MFIMSCATVGVDTYSATWRERFFAISPSKVVLAYKSPRDSEVVLTLRDMPEKNAPASTCDRKTESGGVVNPVPVTTLVKTADVMVALDKRTSRVKPDQIETISH